MKQKRTEHMGLPDSLLPQQVSSESGAFRHGSGFGISRGVVVLLVVLIIGVVSMYWYAQHRASQDVLAPYEKQSVSPDMLSPGFPVNLPYLSGPVVFHNYETAGGGGKVEAVRKWEVVAASSAVTEAYGQFFAKFGWEVITRVDQPGLQVYGARKDVIFLTTSIQPATGGNGSIIEVTVKPVK